MVEGFIIYPTYRIENEKAYVYLIGRLKDGRSFYTRNYYRPYFYIERHSLNRAKEIEPNLEYENDGKKNLEEKPLVKVILDIPTHLPEIRKKFEDNNIECYEADIRFAYRYMIDKGLLGSIKIKGKESNPNEVRADVCFEEPVLENASYQPKKEELRILALDIETSMNGDLLYCISLKSNDKKLNKVLIVSDQKLEKADSYKDEKSLLEGFKEELQEYDPDIITGWNVIDFDFKCLKEKIEKLNLNFNLGRFKEPCSLKITDSFITDSKADFKGRLVLDGIHILKSNFVKLEDYKLDTAAKEYTSEEKLIGGVNKGQDIERAYKENQQKLVDYNLLDSELCLEILDKSGTMDLTIHRSILTGMPLDRVRASIASFDSLYLRELNKKGYIAPSVSYKERGERTTGGYVMDSKPGIYDYIGVFDFKSLYPSIMRTFNIDPLSFRADCKPREKEELIEAPNGVCFSKEEGILPSILGGLAREREKATKKGDKITRGAIKILMNSMYGVLASPNCRFYSFEMANAITSFGHKMIKDTAKLAEKKGYQAIYGDTDSVFIELKTNSLERANNKGKEFEEEVNDYYKNILSKEYGLKSYLVLELEKIFKKFFMPHVRGREKGAKKRYAGLIEENGKEKIDFTGLEFVRRDWTELSKKFQLELLDKLFKEKGVKNYIKNFVKKLEKGEYDDLLVYRKAIRKDLKEYTKTTPPHVKAARKLDEVTDNVISYVITENGPEPVEKQENAIDYSHYIEKQIKPIADSVLYFYNIDFDEIFQESKQTSLGSF